MGLFDFLKVVEPLPANKVAVNVQKIIEKQETPTLAPDTVGFEESYTELRDAVFEIINAQNVESLHRFQHRLAFHDNIFKRYYLNHLSLFDPQKWIEFLVEVQAEITAQMNKDKKYEKKDLPTSANYLLLKNKNLLKTNIIENSDISVNTILDFLHARPDQHLSTDFGALNAFILDAVFYRSTEILDNKEAQGIQALVSVVENVTEMYKHITSFITKDDETAYTKKIYNLVKRIEEQHRGTLSSIKREIPFINTHWDKWERKYSN